MDLVGQQRITRQYEELINDLAVNPPDLLGPLIQAGVLDLDDQERILAECTSRDKAKCFLRIIVTKEDSYEKFHKVLGVAHPHLVKALDNVEIDLELIKRQRQDFVTFVKEFLGRHYTEDDDEHSVLYAGHVMEDFRAELYRHGKSSKGHSLDAVERILLEVFPKAKKEKIRKKKKTTEYKYKYLRRIACTDSEEEADETVEETRPKDIGGPATVEKIQAVSKIESRQIRDLSAVELSKLLRDKFEKEGLDGSLLEVLVEEEVTGKVFLSITTEETKDLFPNLTFGKRKTIINLRDEIVEEEKRLLQAGSYLVPPEEQTVSNKREDNTEENATSQREDEIEDVEIQVLYRESFRKFDTPANIKTYYRQYGTLYTSHTMPTDMIHPVHRFLHDGKKQLKEIPSWVGKESVTFIAACLNARTNGTLHFGVQECDGYGEIIGVQAIHKDVLNSFYSFIHDTFREEDFETVCRCIKPPQFVEVTNPDYRRKLSVIEVDVIASHDIIQDKAFILRKSNKGRKEKGLQLVLFKENDVREASESELVEYMEKKTSLSEQRKVQEKRYTSMEIPERKDLRQKFLNLFSAGNDILSDEIYPLLFLSPLESDMDRTYISERFDFINDIDPKAVFDFDSNGDGNSLHKFIENDQGKVYRVVTVDEFDRDNEAYANSKDGHKNFLEDMRTSSHTPWIFCNGYEPMAKNPLTPLEWKQKLAEGYKESLRFYSGDLQKGRVIPIFLLLSKNYEILLGAADEALTKFQGQWINMAETENIASTWMDELVKRHLTDKKTLEDRCIIGIPWLHVNSMIKQVMGCMQSHTKQIPTSTGAFCYVKERVKNELCDIDLLGVNECNIDDIKTEGKTLEEHRRSVREVFFHGGQVTWWNFFFRDDHVLIRDKHKLLMDYTKKALAGDTIDEDNKVAVIDLHHQPMAGGTTSAKQVLWTMKDQYRCCVIKQITDQTVEQITRLRNYEDQEQPKPPVILIDNGDEDCIERLRVHLEERAKIVYRRSDTPFKVFCLLFLCTRRANLSHTTDHKTVQLKHELSETELEWFKRKGDFLQQQFKADKGVNPKLLISFNILKENFSADYIKRTVVEFVDSIVEAEELSLLRYISLLNAYDLDFQPIPVSSFDSLMEQTPGSKVVHGSVSRYIGRRSMRQKHWDARLSQSLLVLLNRNARGSYFTGLAIISSLFAKAILDYMLLKSETTPSKMMLDFLHSDIFTLKNRSLEVLKKIVTDILKKREVNDQRFKEKFSPLILDIMEREGIDQAQKVFETAFEISNEDAMVAQQIARFFIHSKNWDKATQYASQATEKKPDNSFLWDTCGQVYLKKLTEKYLQCTAEQKPLTNEDADEAIRLAHRAINLFQKEQDVSEKEKTVRTNDAGYYAELHVVKLLLDLLRFWPPLEKGETVHMLLVNEAFVPDGLESLDPKLIEILKQLRGRTESLIRIVDEKDSQLKTDFCNEIFVSSTNTVKSKYVQLRFGLDSYFGEDTNEVPSDLSFQEQAEYRRRRVKNLGGKTLIEIIDMMRKRKLEDLLIMYRFLRENVESDFCTPYDLLTLISVSIFINRLECQDVTIQIRDLLNWSKRLHRLTVTTIGDTGSGSRPYLEGYLYPIMLHWPTENRREHDTAMCSVKEIRDAQKLLRTAFHRNHPRQKEEGGSLRKRDTTYFFLGNGKGLKEIVYFEDFKESHGARFDKWDNIWEKPEVRRLLLRVKGIVMKEGQEVSVNVSTRLGNQESLIIPTAQPIGQRSLWQKEVYFFIGFSWSGPKAYDVSKEGPLDANSIPAPMKIDVKNSIGKHEHISGGIDTHESFQKRIREVERQLGGIKKMKECAPKKSGEYKALVDDEKRLREEKEGLMSRKRALLEFEN